MNKKNFKQNFSIDKRNLKSEGNFFQASNQILFDPNLTESSKVLLFALTSTSFPRIHLNFFQKRFGWSNDKLSKTVKLLKANGYLNVDKKSNGYKKGFEYYYKISEFGNLNTTQCEALDQKNEEFNKTILKYEYFLQYPWFITLIQICDGDSKLLEDALKEFFKD